LLSQRYWALAPVVLDELPPGRRLRGRQRAASTIIATMNSRQISWIRALRLPARSSILVRSSPRNSPRGYSVRLCFWFQNQKQSLIHPNKLDTPTQTKFDTPTQTHPPRHTHPVGTVSTPVRGHPQFVPRFERDRPGPRMTRSAHSSLTD
jgi:hypothetical protein